MNKILLITFISIIFGCSRNSKDFSSVRVGMTSKEVLVHAGEPDKKNDLGIADLWIYERADRTVVFREDTVYDIITSADARIDSIKTSLDNLGDKIENQAEKAADRLDSARRKLENSSKDDSLFK